MAFPNLPDEKIEEIVRLWAELGGNIKQMALRLKISRSAVDNRLDVARNRGHVFERPKPDAAPGDAKHPVDLNLKPFATRRQWECYIAWCTTGSIRGAADKLNINKDTQKQQVKALLRKAAQQGYAPDHDLVHQVPDGLTLRGTSLRYNKDGEVEQYWNKSKVEGRSPDEVVTLPDPKKILRTATLFDQQGNVSQQWVTEKAEDKEREELWRLFAEEMSAKVERVEPIAPPEHACDDLLALFPIGDHHHGMLAWGEETRSDNYDMKISERLLTGATDYLLAAAPPCKTALLAFLGDLTHRDGFEPVTPTSRNILDADGRYPKMIRTAIRMMRYMIVASLKRHERVHVIIESGNHDLVSTVFLTECLFNVYENEPRVTIDRSPSHYHYFEFGKTLIGTHHGHGAKMEDLPGIMAADQSAAWGRTKYRYWLTGHIHKKSSMDFAGCSVESFRILAPVDAWAAQKGYRSQRDMCGIVIHKEHGEVARHRVNPGMFTKAA